MDDEVNNIDANNPATNNLNRDIFLLLASDVDS